jgi:hypothetical protein
MDKTLERKHEMTNKAATLPEIREKDIQDAKNNQLDFLFLFAEKYQELIDNDSTGKIITYLNNSQKTLLSFIHLNAQVAEGGFIQLIKNGFGEMIFNNSFIEIIKLWGADKISEIIEEGNEIYKKYKNEIEKAETDEELNKIYTKTEAFEMLDGIVLEIMEEEGEKIKKYIEKNINEFAVIIRK